jgi:hypothetical protein
MGRRAGGTGRQRTIPRPPDVNRSGVSGDSGRYVDRPWRCPASHGKPVAGMGVKMAWWTTWRASSRPGVTAGSPWLWRAFSHSYGSAGVRRPPVLAGCPASRGHRPRCAAHGGRGRGDQAVGRAVAGDGGPSGQGPVQPYRRRGLLGAGAAVLAATGQYRWIAVWICFGVGVHFFPPASTLDNRSLRLLGALLAAVAAAALTAGLASATAPSTVTGAGAGLCLLAFGVATCLIGGRAPADANELVER